MTGSSRLLAAFTIAVAAPLPGAGAQATDSAAGVVASALPTRAAAELRRASLRYAPAVRTCYEREGLLQDPVLRGRLEVSFTIVGSGAISDIVVDTLDVTGIGMREVARCVAEEATRWHFSTGAFAPDAVLLAFDLLPPPMRSAGDTVAVPAPSPAPSPSPSPAPVPPPTRPR
jgi:hypothetical protein